MTPEAFTPESIALIRAELWDLYNRGEISWDELRLKLGNLDYYEKNQKRAA